MQWIDEAAGIVIKEIIGSFLYMTMGSDHKTKSTAASALQITSTIQKIFAKGQP